MGSLAAPPRALRDLVADDLRAVKPLRKPWARAAATLPLALLLLIAAPVIFGVRQDADRLGWILTWGASLLQLAVGMRLVSLALRESVPGRALPRALIWASLGLAIGTVVVVAIVTWFVSPIRITTESVGYVSAVWFGHTLLGALPVILLLGVLVARAYPLRPHVAGALYGAAGGLLSDAGWRLFCHYSDPLHVIPVHLGAVVAAILLGVLCGSVFRPRGH
jgi:hypothetical protein